MKKLTSLIAALAALSLSLVFGQDAATSGKGSARTETREEGLARLQSVKNAESHLTKFNLDFPGGTPKQLVDAIQKAMGGRPLNAVIPVEYADWKLPPLKMNGVDVAQLFLALEQASHSTSVLSIGDGRVRTGQTQYGFRQAEGRPTEDTVWFFTAKGQMEIPKVSRYYYLAPYLDGGLTVDDITTAIQTGWRLRGDAPTPALSFHKETKLLITVGDNAGLDVIDQVLKALDAVKAKPVTEKPVADPKTKP
jgi:hypothetical protein